MSGAFAKNRMSLAISVQIIRALGHTTDRYTDRHYSINIYKTRGMPVTNLVQINPLTRIINKLMCRGWDSNKFY